MIGTEPPENIHISTNKGLLNINYVHDFLKHSYWSPGIPFPIVEKAIEGSICFGVYIKGEQIGFARVITDKATFAYLADVFIDEKYRGKGYSKILMKEIMSHPDLRGLRRFMLATRDAHGLYSQFGFSALTYSERWMQIHNPDAYKIK